MKIDATISFICSETSEVTIAVRGYEPAVKFEYEIAKADVHGRAFDLSNVREARGAKMEYFR